MTARAGMAIFHIMITLLDFARLATPRRFMIVQTAMRMTEITMPIGVRRTAPADVWVRNGNQRVIYCIMARTSMGATVTAPTHTIHPVVNPARLPKEKWGYRAEPPATGY